MSYHETVGRLVATERAHCFFLNIVANDKKIVIKPSDNAVKLLPGTQVTMKKPALIFQQIEY